MINTYDSNHKQNLNLFGLNKQYVLGKKKLKIYIFVIRILVFYGHFLVFLSFFPGV